MAKAKRTPPKFKVGDWVKVTKDGLLLYGWDGKPGPWQITHMRYYAPWSLWSCNLNNTMKTEVFEEDLEYDVFLTESTIH